MPLEICEQRDPKQLYAKARQGQIPDFTGISSPDQLSITLDSARFRTHLDL